MNERVKKQLKLLKSGEYKIKRNEKEIKVDEQKFKSITDFNLKTAYIFCEMLKAEQPVFFGDDRIGFNRFNVNFPTSKNYEVPQCGNVTPDYQGLLENGLEFYYNKIKLKITNCPPESLTVYQSMLICLEAAFDLVERYRQKAKIDGKTELYNALCNVPLKPAKSFLEAVISVKFLQYTLRCNQNVHIGIGRFDQYMYKYYLADLKKGVKKQEISSILEEFFISLNFDNDIYFGIQSGDNGQSLMLGGYDLEGNDCYNDLSEMCIKASEELCLIDPKINLRVNKTTPIERLITATHLTKKGLGFPQYSNDDVIVDGLINLGYAPEDAADYTVAACWECIIPGKGMDIPNFYLINYPLAVETAIKVNFNNKTSFEEFLHSVKQNLTAQCVQCADWAAERSAQQKDYSPYLSIFINDCIERGLCTDAGGAVYRNFGFHGVGIANAADSVWAIKKKVFIEKKYTADEIKQALNSDFKDETELRNELLSIEKMGNNEDSVDNIAVELMDTVAESFKKLSERDGIIYRAGTGSAQEYIFSAQKVGATPDGRYANTPFGSSFSPAISTRLNGPLSVLKSFTKPNLVSTVNGGPITMEIHDSVFRNDLGIEKTAYLVKNFIDLGGHQLQLNSINRDTLTEAQKNPEKYKNLSVRVWGWSGYFTELDVKFQNHIIERAEHNF